MADNGRGMSLAKIFWIAACLDVVLILVPALDEWNHPSGEFSGLVVLGAFAIILFLAVIMLAVAVTRKRMAYWIGLALLAVPTAYVAIGYASYIIVLATRPGAEDLRADEAARKARHGDFTTAADRALADAIVAGDASKVASLAPAANLNAVGRDGMTFMRLALEDGQADPAVVAALLRAGADPDQDRQVLFGFIRSESEDVDSGVMVGGKNERLLRAVIDAGVDLNQLDSVGKPRFFALLRWPEGLSFALEHGANIETEDQDADTAIMLAVAWDYWPAVDVLLAHGARIDRVDRHGGSLRDLVIQKLAWYRTYPPKPPVPPPLLALEARLR
jgi:ankyrin repeat protein